MSAFTWTGVARQPRLSKFSGYCFSMFTLWVPRWGQAVFGRDHYGFGSYVSLLYFHFCLSYSYSSFFCLREENENTRQMQQGAISHRNSQCSVSGTISLLGILGIWEDLDRVVQSPMKLTQDQREFWFQFFNFSVWFSVCTVCLSVPSLNNFELRSHKQW